MLCNCNTCDLMEVRSETCDSMIVGILAIISGNILAIISGSILAIISGSILAIISGDILAIISGGAYLRLYQE